MGVGDGGEGPYSTGVHPTNLSTASLLYAECRASDRQAYGSVLSVLSFAAHFMHRSADLLDSSPRRQLVVSLRVLSES